MITVCVPVLKRYDLLRNLVLSLQDGSVLPEKLCIIDNGRNPIELRGALDTLNKGLIALDVLTPDQAMGLAESWNWFIKNIREERFIVNDDIEFGRTSIEDMVFQTECFVSCTFGFSCFLLRDECVRRVGLFDENISPGYAYYEDVDYFRRMQIAGIVDKVIHCGVTHAHSQTVQSFNSNELAQHSARFELARKNYGQKWGDLRRDAWEWGPIPPDGVS